MHVLLWVSTVIDSIGFLMKFAALVKCYSCLYSVHQSSLCWRVIIFPLSIKSLTGSACCKQPKAQKEKEMRHNCHLQSVRSLLKSILPWGLVTKTPLIIKMLTFYYWHKSSHSSKYWKKSSRFSNQCQWFEKGPLLTIHTASIQEVVSEVSIAELRNGIRSWKRGENESSDNSWRAEKMEWLNWFSWTDVCITSVPSRC